MRDDPGIRVDVYAEFNVTRLEYLLMYSNSKLFICDSILWMGGESPSLWPLCWLRLVSWRPRSTTRRAASVTAQALHLL